jgi:hypothetical protein
MNQWVFCIGISSLSILIGSGLRKITVNEFHPQIIRSGEAHREHQIAAKQLLHEVNILPIWENVGIELNNITI